MHNSHNTKVEEGLLGSTPRTNVLTPHIGGAEFKFKYKLVAHKKEDSKWMRQRWTAEFRTDLRKCATMSSMQTVSVPAMMGVEALAVCKARHGPGRPLYRPAFSKIPSAGVIARMFPQKQSNLECYLPFASPSPTPVPYLNEILHALKLFSPTRQSLYITYLSHGHVPTLVTV